MPGMLNRPKTLPPPNSRLMQGRGSCAIRMNPPHKKKPGPEGPGKFEQGYQCWTFLIGPQSYDNLTWVIFSRAGKPYAALGSAAGIVPGRGGFTSQGIDFQSFKQAGIVQGQRRGKSGGRREPREPCRRGKTGEDGVT
jgi:hypothetical protein